jgi:hypothetical protein
MVTFMPILIKNRNLPQKKLDEWRNTNREVLNQVLGRVTHPLTFTQNSSTESGYYNVLCAHGNFRGCKPVFPAWFEDCRKYSDLHHLEQYVCVWCEFPQDEQGDFVPPVQEQPRQDQNLYRTHNEGNTKLADANLL